jgi:hypothetical protein
VIRSFNRNFSFAHDMRGEGGVQAVVSGTGMPLGGEERSFNNAGQALSWLAAKYRQEADDIERALRKARAGSSLILPRSYT